MKYLTLTKAQGLISVIPDRLSDNELQKHIVKLRDFKGYIDHSDMPRLFDGGYFAIVIDESASGFAPRDIWLHANLGNALDEATAERSKRQYEVYATQGTRTS